MEKFVIRLVYRKIIDGGSQDPWEKLVFDDTYSEFLMQAQTFDPHKIYNTYRELILNMPDASKLPFMVSPSILGYLRQLNGKIPNIVNLVDKHFMTFKNYSFEIINSEIRDKSAHQVAINFISEPLIWYNTIGDKLLVSTEGGNTDERGEVLTEMFVMQPFLSIFSIKKTTGDDHTI